jgi:tetratricopeptide (TPR) repeat protein
MRFSVCMMIVLTLLSVATLGRADDVAAARDHYAKGKRAYDLGHFAEAAKEYEAAYQAKDDPALLFNLGQAHRLARNYPEAILAYKAFLRNVPDASNRTDVESRIHEMQAALDERAQANQKSLEETAKVQTAPLLTKTELTKSPTDRREAPPAARKRTWIWGVVAGAVVIVGVGVGLGVGLGVHDKDPSATFGAVSAR